MAHRGLVAGAVLLCLGLAGCGTLPGTKETPQLPAGLYGLYLDNDTGAINFAAWAFASPARLRGRPGDAARAVIAVEYLAGDLRQNPRWIAMSPTTKLEMVQAKADLRRVLGIAPDTPPQVVVNVLLGVDWNLRVGNTAEALRALSAPGFTLPPAETLKILTNMPYVKSANVATLDASRGALAEPR